MASSSAVTTVLEMPQPVSLAPISSKTSRTSPALRPREVFVSNVDNAIDGSANASAMELSTLQSAQKSTPSEVASSPDDDKKLVRRERVYIAALCWCLFLAGWNDGTTGPLLRTIQDHYQVSFIIVSMLFVSNCVGFLSAAGLNVYLNDRFGFGTVLVIGALSQVVAYAVQSPAPPFPLLCLGYGLNGFGLALQDAQANGFVASLPKNASTKMGILHAIYGLGAFSSPLIATQFAQIPRWSFHYLVSLGLAVSNAVVLALLFRFRTQDQVLARINVAPEETSPSEHSKYRQIMSQKSVHLLAFFIFVYVGCEVTIGGWSVTYVIDVRHGGPSAGYVSSGFFGGLTIGRVALLWVNEKIGETRVIYLYSILALALEFTVWFIPSLIQNAIAVALIGVLLGPMYPVCMNVAGQVLPRWLLTGAIGWIASFGQAGSAAFPFLTGALAQKYGVKVLQPVIVGMLCTMLVLWSLVPGKKRGD